MPTRVHQPPTARRCHRGGAARRSLASLSHPLGRRPREHLHPRQRRPPSRTRPQEAAPGRR